MVSLSEETLHLAQSLIRNHPAYNSQGLHESFVLIAEYMRNNNWDSVVVDHFSAEQIKGLDVYVPVANYSELYTNYEEVPKTNVLGIIESGKPGPQVILNGHVDVDYVSTPERWRDAQGWKSGRIADGCLHGRGATDMLAGLSSLLAVSSSLARRRQDWRGSLLVQAVTDEEIGGNGTLRALEFCKNKGLIRKDALAIIAEPTENTLCFYSLGFLSFKVELMCSSVHMGIASDAHRLDKSLCTLLTELKECVQRKLSGSKENYRLSIGTIRAGHDPALPLGSLELCGTAFFPAQDSIKSVKNALADALTDLLPKNVASNLSFESIAFPGSDSSFASAAQKFYKTNSKNLKQGVFPSPCDARLFEAYDIPSLIFGPGSLAQAHAVDEYILVKEIKTYTRSLELALLKYLQ